MKKIILQRPLWAVPVVIWTAVVAASLIWNWGELDRHARTVAENRAHFIFKMVESVRLWNARHGGVYAEVDKDTLPNPYLEVPEREIYTFSGRALTLLNPAYMTRQLAAVVQEISGNIVHITSLKPINPGNEPFPWEREALRAFEDGKEEWTEFVGQGGDAVFRYMSPLVTEKPCLKCHEQQGYKVGDIRGGISVAFAAGSIMAPILEQRANMLAVHLGVWLLLAGLTLFALSRFRSQMLSLQSAKAEQDALVEQRTRQLREEVKEREEAEGRLRLFIESSGEGIVGVDERGHCTLVNPMALRLLGYADAGEVVGKEVDRLIHYTDPDGTPHMPADCPLRAAQREGREVHDDRDFFTRADGTRFPVEYRSHPLFRDGRVVGAVVTFSDISERRALQEQIWRQANYDGLTGLVNRHLFQDRLEHYIARARRNGRRFALLFIDLDGFKEVNDHRGHESGDLLLRELGRRLAGCLRAGDTVARMGGDEFTVILPDVQAREDVEAAAKKVVACLHAPVALEGGEVAVSGSVGIALYPEDGDSSSLLMRRADTAMYRAKNAGAGEYRFYGGDRP